MNIRVFNYNINYMKYLQLILIFWLVAFTQCSSTKNTGSSSNNIFNDSTTQELINSKHYTFVAQYAQPLGGRQRALTTEYTLTVHNDSLISYLPYYGQSYTAPINPSDAGMEFTSINFDYTVTPTKNGNYDITIKPKNEDKANQMILNVTSTGYASLQVTSSNRQAISFRGIMRK